MAAVVWIFLLNLLLLSRFAFFSPVHLDKVMNSVDNLVEYYRNNYHNLNLDGLFGLRVIEGHLGSLIERYQNGSIRSINFTVIDKLKSMKRVATTVSNQAIDFVKKDDEKYFKSMQFLVRNPWTYHKEYQKLQFQLLWEPSVFTKSMKLDEGSSDDCMMEIMGYQSSQKKCGVSHFCQELMTSKGMTGYGITHQLLWSMLAEQAGCAGALSDLFISSGKGKPEYIQLELCTNNYLEMMQIVHGTLKGLIVPRFQDLFMEQQFICPSLGFYQFLSDDFLNQILSWQKDVGCFGTMKRPKTQKLLQTQLFEGYEYEDDFQDLKFDSLLKNNNSGSNKNSYTIQPPSLSLVTETNKRLGNVHMTSNVVMQKGTDLVHRTSNKVLNTFSQGSGFKVTSPPKVKAGLRRLLVEKLLNDGCLAHKTAVAAGALMVYLRYLILPGPKTLAENTQEMLQQRRLLNIKDFGAVKHENGGNPIKSGLQQKGHAMNNNVLAAQINDKDDDYYADDNEENEEEEEDKGGNKNVQFDENQNKDNNDGNDDDDNEYEGDYDENKEDSKKNLHVKNLADNDNPKPDDTDYTYYDDKNKHDDYTNDEYDEKDEKDSIKDSSGGTLKVKLIHESKTGETYHQSNLQSPSGVFIIVTLTMIVLLILMYRFLKKRRVHIRYNYKSFNRV